MTLRLTIIIFSAVLLGLHTDPAAASPSRERSAASPVSGGSETERNGNPASAPSDRGGAPTDAERTEPARRDGGISAQPIAKDEALRIALRAIEEDGGKAVLRNDQPIHIFYDFDGDSFEDISVLTVAREQEYLIERLSDFSRLFRDDARPVDLSLRVFLQRDGGLITLSVFPLGRKYVVDSLRKISLHRSDPLPVAVGAVCLTVQGSEQEWILFPDRGSPSRFTIQESPAIRTTLEDLDGDGYLDVIKEEKAFEEGTGYETFLTWYRWNGKSYAVHRSTNIVRNLRAFLDRSSDLLSAADPGAFLSFGIEREILEELRRRGFGNGEIVDMIFREGRTEAPLEGSSGKGAGLPERISGVVFPAILENPFVRIANLYYLFRVSVRIDGDDGRSGIYHTEIVMSGNPFRDRQFSFLPRNAERNE